jgi:hypothetical protein
MYNFFLKLKFVCCFPMHVAKQQMAFAKKQERFPTFLSGGYSWRPKQISPENSLTQTTERPMLQTIQQTSFLGYRSYLKRKRNAAQVSPSSTADEGMSLSPSPQTQ